MKLRFAFIVAVLIFSACYSKRDEADALNAAAQIHAHLQAGEFRAIHKQASQGFRRAMDESTFVSGMTQLFKDNGAIQKITPVAYQSGVDSKAGKTHTVIFDLDCERTRARERLVFTRSSAGQLELWDLVMDRIH